MRRRADGVDAERRKNVNARGQSKKVSGGMFMQVINRSRRAVVATALAGIAALATGTSAMAQDFPTKPVTIVVPFGPGTANDIIARQLAQDMTATLGQSVIVENRPGSTGNIAVEYVSKAKPYGYTLVIASMSNILNQATGNTTTDLIKDFAPVAFSGKTPYSMLVPNELPVKTVADLVELAKK